MIGCKLRDVDMNKHMSAVIIAMSLLSSCAIVYEEKYTFSDGWREASVINEGVPADPDLPLQIDCRKPEATPLGERYVTVRYVFQNAHFRNGVFRVSQGAHFKPCELVYVNVADCSQPVKKHK